MTHVYHYTKGRNLAGILDSGFIKREGEAGHYGASSKVFFKKYKIDRQVWLTKEAEMPFTATPQIFNRMGLNVFAHCQKRPDRGYGEWHDIVDGVYRFVFSIDNIKAVSYINGLVRLKMKKFGILNQFEEAAKSGGDDLSQWYHVNKPIDISLAIDLEVWDTQSSWRSAGMNILIKGDFG
jgi:hypothetical protein